MFKSLVKVMIGTLATFALARLAAGAVRSDTPLLAHIQPPRASVAGEGVGLRGALDEPRPAISQCVRCHVDAARADAASAHGRAAIGCQSCHSFNQAPPGISPMEHPPTSGRSQEIFAQVTMNTCARCHMAEVRAWRDGRHVDPVTYWLWTWRTVGDRERADEVPLRPKFEWANNCLICHRPHRFH